MKVLLFAASLRKDSLNRKLAAIVAELLREHNVELDHADFHEFDMPLYDGDIETASGLPAGAQDLTSRIAASDLVVIVTPEYNAGIPGTLKNAIDWVSRAKPMPLKDKCVMVLTASISLVGEMNSQWATRQSLERLGAFIHPLLFMLPQADKQFDDNGAFLEEKHRERLASAIAACHKFAGSLHQQA
jgi:chromate reductase